MKQEETERKHHQNSKTRIVSCGILSVTKQDYTPAMLLKISLVFLVVISILSGAFEAIARTHDHGHSSSILNSSTLTGIEMPGHVSFNAVSSSTSNGCTFSKHNKSKQSRTVADKEDEEEETGFEYGRYNPDSAKQTVKLHLKRQPVNQESEPKDSVFESARRDLARIQTLYRRVVEKKNLNLVSRLKRDKEQRVHLQKPAVIPAAAPESIAKEVSLSGQLMATLASGVTLGSGEYFIDVFVGTPPKHFSLILDTGSDLNWIQCVPCHDCFEQHGPYYDPKDSSSYKDIGCHDPRCHLVSSPDPPQPCQAENQTCPYYYWYGDSSNTTGDFALETFTVNLTASGGKSEFKQVENVMFGCGHWNRGLFHGAAGLLGLGRGPLSFASQLQSLYGHSFSYCLVDRNSDLNVSSKLIFGDDKDLLSHPNLNFTSLVSGNDNPADTFYYLQVKSIMVGGQVLSIPEETWNISSDGAGGTIIDSGTTLTYFAEPAYQIIKDAFVKKIKGRYPEIKDFPVLNPCYNVSGVEKLDLPEFVIRFADGAIWDFPVENYFIWLQEDVVCLAVLGTPRSALSIIGNYQQQNFHILYDTKRSRLGYAPMRCADVF